MNKFLVLFMAPAATMAEWMKTPEDERKAAETKMRAEWDTWMKAHSGMIKETAGAGKTKRITSAGVMDATNDIMLFTIAEGESADSVAKAFEGHPHFGIPGSWIDVMPAKYLTAEEM